MTFLRYVTVITFLRYVTVITFIRYVTVITFLGYVTVITFLRYAQNGKLNNCIVFGRTLVLLIITLFRI